MKKFPALIITYYPASDFYQRLTLFYEELEQIIIVDNGSDSATRARLEEEAQKRPEALEIIFNDQNLGVATALNQGFRWALEKGYSHLFAFDQDSQPSPGTMTALQNFVHHAPDRSSLAILSSVPRDLDVDVYARFLRPKKSIFFERVPCDGEMLTDISFTITSGSLYNLTAYQELGPFRDDFFIDYVDTEYCLRANQAGYKIVALCDAYLEHQLGARQKRELLGRKHYPTFHSPLRWYYISRNRIPMLKKYALRFPHWLSFEIVSASYIFLRMMLFEDQKKAKINAFLHGTWDGLRGRMGKISEKTEKTLK